jgi:hypothetical protein
MNDIDHIDPTLDENEFDIDLGGIDTSIPVLEKDSKMRLRIKKAERKANKKKTGFNLLVYFTNAEPATSTSGTTVAAGEGLISKYFALQANSERVGEEGYNPDRWKSDLAAFIDAVYGTGKDDRPRFNADLIVDFKDREVIAKVDIEKGEDGAYGDKNTASGFKFAQ